MFIVINVVFVAAALLLVLVIAATASIPSRQAVDLDAPEGEWMGAARLPAVRTERVLAHPRASTPRNAVTAPR